MYSHQVHVWWLGTAVLCSVRRNRVTFEQGYILFLQMLDLLRFVTVTIIVRETSKEDRFTAKRNMGD